MSQALARHGIEALLVGGAVVTIYTRNKYRSFDLDYVVRGSDKNILAAMHSIGFRKGSGRHFERPGTMYIVEFLPPPAGIGRVFVETYGTHIAPTGTIQLYEPTHSVMDRLAAFYHWKDEQGLKQAVLVALNRQVRMGEIERWSAGEGHTEGFARFRRTLAAARRRRAQITRPGPV